VGRGPSFVSIDPKMQKVYVASKQGKSVSVIDIKTDKVVDTIAVGRGLDGLTVDTKTDKVYVSDSHPNSIYYRWQE
jgi:YVTN family beta-propeller protein